MPSSLRGAAQVSLAACLWGTWSLYLRPTGLDALVSAPVILVVMGLSGLVLVRFESSPARWDRRAVLLLGAYAVLTAINLTAFFVAMQVTTVAVAVLTHCTAPVIVAMLSPRIEGVTVKGSAIAALVALAGLTLLLEPWSQSDRNVWLGAALGLTSALAYATLVFLVTPLASRIGTARATTYHAILAALLLIPFAATELDRIETDHLLLLALGGVLPGTLAAALFIDGVARIGSARAAVLALLEPVVAVIVGWLVFAEPLAPFAVVGASMVLAAALWVATRERVALHAAEDSPS